MKILNWIFCGLFALFAALQYNDPDPQVWIPIYLFASVLCGLAARRRYYPKAYALGIAVYAAYAGYLFFCPSGVLDWARRHHAESLVQTMKATKPWIEDTREFFGLAILIGALELNAVLARKTPRPQSR